MAFSNSRKGSIILSAKNKRAIQKVYRAGGKSKIYTIQVFSALVYLLLEKHTISDKPVVLDIEYAGQEGLIKSYILQLVRKRCKIKLNTYDLGFFGIGKSSTAHKVAIENYRKHRGDYVITKDELTRLVDLYDF